ncbi:MAG TPA: acetyl-CoA C-acyltransferase, partial [Gemmatimonadales bacterium]|nr:acetyl-CoA C-acyltransferase [Gemmatimonadales bacterium]
MSHEREQRVVFLSAVRTGFGAFGGTLRSHSATDLGAIATQCALARSGVTSDEIDHVIFGNVVQTSTDAAYLARHIGLSAGLPIEVPAVTVNRLCGSGFEAIIQGAHRILLGEAKAVVAGGTESMTQAPYVLRGARFGTKLGQAPVLEDSLWDSLRDTYCGLPMGDTAENLGKQYGVTRADADAYALSSQQRAKSAWEAGAFRQEVIPVAVRNPKTGTTTEWVADEHMRPDSTAEGLAKLPPVFRKDGLVTAGNASGVSDGAAAVVLADERWAAERGLRPLGRLIAWAVSGVDPALMGIGP